MTPEDKIKELVKHINKEFPKGCLGVQCNNCHLHQKQTPVDEYICETLWCATRVAQGVYQDTRPIDGSD